MSSPKKSSPEEIQLFLDTNTSWQIKNEKLHKTFVFNDFIEAFGFMSQIAIIAEKDNHHPEWFNIYKTVEVDLITHDTNGISAKDFFLAITMDTIANRTKTLK